MTPGMHVSVVNSYDAASLSVAVKVLRRVDYKQKKEFTAVILVQLGAYIHIQDLTPCVFM
jgi:hypothetical protein